MPDAVVKESALTAFRDVQRIGHHLRDLEYLLGLAPEKPREMDWDGVQCQIIDIRGALGRIALELSALTVDTPPELLSQLRSMNRD